jgi:predicted nucleotidyltransferase
MSTLGFMPVPQVQAYLADVRRTCESADDQVISIILFGSAVTGGYSSGISDVDVLFVVRDEAGVEERNRLVAAILAVEARHGLGKLRRGRPGLLERFADRVTASERTFFVCTRADLLSGDPARILGISRAQARFVDRVAVPSIIGSGVVLWGEDLLAAVPLPPIRRLDVAKAFLGLFSQALFSAAAYPLLPGATRYAMDALKRSVHNCYFCYEGRPASLEEEVDYLDRVQGPSGSRRRLMELRRRYEPSAGFVLGALVTITGQHAITAWSNSFPRVLRAVHRP